MKPPDYCPQRWLKQEPTEVSWLLGGPWFRAGDRFVRVGLRTNRRLDITVGGYGTEKQVKR